MTLANNKKRNRKMVFIPVYEKAMAQKDLSAKAYALLEYYYNRSDYWNWKDTGTVEELGWSDNQVQDYRKELIEKKYLHIVNGFLLDKPK